MASAPTVAMEPPVSAPPDYGVERHELLFGAEVSVRYHRRRAAFLEMVNTWLNVLTLVGGAAAFVTLFKPGTAISVALALLLTMIGIIQIVFSPQACASRHKEWHRNWQKLLRDIKSAPHPTLEQIQRWTVTRHAIEAECLIEMRALEADCYNRTVRVMGLEQEHNYDIRWRHRRFCQVMRFEHAFEGPPQLDKLAEPTSSQEAINGPE